MSNEAKWKRLLIATKRGLVSCGANVELILCHDPRWQGVLAYDEFSGSIVFKKEPPWHAESRGTVKQKGSAWVDEDATRLANWLARSAYKLLVSDAVVNTVVPIVAQKSRFHPVRDWLEELTWDNTPRIDDWLTRLAGAPDTPVVRAAGAKFLIAAVARVYEPGCQVDTVPIFEGKQGVGKSSLVRELAAKSDWYLETNIELGDKDSYQLLRRKWLIELAELDSLNRSELSRMKSYITNKVDTYRPSYGRGARDFPRQCVFIGTTNAGEYLKDDTGARRFWPVAIEKVDIKALRKEREMLWAEAVARYKKGEKWYITDRKLNEAFEAAQEERRQIDPWEPFIVEYMLKGYRDGNFQHHPAPKGPVTVNRILTGPLGVDPARITRFEQMRVGAILKKLGWERRRAWIGGEHGGYEYVRRPGSVSDAQESQNQHKRVAPVIKLEEKRGTTRLPPHPSGKNSRKQGV